MDDSTRIAACISSYRNCERARIPVDGYDATNGSETIHFESYEAAEAECDKRTWPERFQ